MALEIKPPFIFLGNAEPEILTQHFRQWLRTKDIVKLNIGAGSENFGSEWIHIDGVLESNIQVVADVVDLKMFPNECVDIIESNHCLEHVGTWRTSLGVLKEWTRLLKVGGEIVIRCPDLGVMCEAYVQGTWGIKRPNEGNNILPVIFGNFENETFGTHRAGFDKNLICSYLAECGLYEVRAGPSDRGHFFELKASGKKADL